MAKMWDGRFKKELDRIAHEFNSSIKIDKRMYKQDILGSIAHAKMLYKQNIIIEEDYNKIIKGLNDILVDIENKNLIIDENAEDIHMFVEAELTKRIGDSGKRLHTSRSRNDQVALDIRFYLKDEIKELKVLLVELIRTLTDLSKKHLKTIMPGYTHLQRAQPITFAYHLMAYVNMFLRDIERLTDTYKRVNISPLGSLALAGTTYNIDREYTAKLLGFSKPTENALDSISDRDFVVELANDISLIMMHLSRFSEEIILWCSFEFKFIELDDAYSTGSSIMPQKKNPDIPELIRGKTGRVYGNLISLYTMLKALPLAYNKDMQEDKEAIFDSIDTVKDCLIIFNDMIKTIKVNEENMKNAASRGFINATDLADYLVKKGLPFRSAYKITGELVAYCIDNNTVLEKISLDEYKKFNELFDNDLYQFIDLEYIVSKRNSFGGPSYDEVSRQIKTVLDNLKE